MKRRRFAIAGIAAVLAITAAAPNLARLVGGNDANQARNRPSVQEAALEAAVFRYETWARRRPLREVDCERPAPLFRGKPSYRCSIRFKDSNGLDADCYALVGRALYEVGGCFDPLRDMGVGKSRLLTRSGRKLR